MRENFNLSQRKRPPRRVCNIFRVIRHVTLALSVTAGIVSLWMMRSETDTTLSDYHISLDMLHKQKEEEYQARNLSTSTEVSLLPTQEDITTSSTNSSSSSASIQMLPEAFQSVLERAKRNFDHCKNLDLPHSPPNMTLDVDLPSFGIIDALSSAQPGEKGDEWQCSLPPATECDVTKFTVIFMGYKVDRLFFMRKLIQRMTRGEYYSNLIEEVIFVWNNPKSLESVSQIGKDIVDRSRDIGKISFRVFSPMEHGLENDLMNRYHPKIRPKSKAILYYDDDGPFYDRKPILSAFELWRRNADAQVGAMPRAFTLSKRQQAERLEVLGGGELDDRKFISHCRDCGDVASYDFREFTPFHANMVLPSGTFLHRDYLCFLWHPALEQVRTFVRDHPVHPDDVTVSTIVSQLSGRSPLTYSRRLPKKRRRLQEESFNATSMRRRLLWQEVNDWGNLRSTAVNSLAAYFGSVSSGSLGWCYKTPYHKTKGDRHRCDPEIARDGMLPWMQEGGFRNDICPLIEK